MHPDVLRRVHEVLRRRVHEALRNPHTHLRRRVHEVLRGQGKVEGLSRSFESGREHEELPHATTPIPPPSQGCEREGLRTIATRRGARRDCP